MAHQSLEAAVHHVRIEGAIGDGGRDQVLGEYVDRAVDVLIGVAGPLHRDALGPAGDAVLRDRLDKENVARLLRAERRAEGAHQGHLDAMESDLGQPAHAATSREKT